MRTLLLCTAALFAALPSAAPPAGAAARPVMLEGVVRSVGAGAFMLRTPAVGVYCPPGAACPLVLLAPRDFRVTVSRSTVIAGPYLDQLPDSAVTTGEEVVVYGEQAAAPQGARAGGVLLAGVVAAEGVYVLKVVPCSTSAGPACLSARPSRG